MARSGGDLHSIRIRVPRGQRVLANIELDGEPMKGVFRVRFDTGDSNRDRYAGDGLVHVIIDLMADLEVEILELGDGQLSEPR